MRIAPKIAFHQTHFYPRHLEAAAEMLTDFAEQPEVLTSSALSALSSVGAYDAGAYARLTGSCTQALELIALALDLAPGDDIILPSFTFSGTANAFVQNGARLIFADVDPEDMNLSPASVARLISNKTRAVIPIHYGGRAADMDALSDIVRAYPRAQLIEDAAHGIGARYKGIPLGHLGAMGALSFHRTKNITAGGSGGLLTLQKNQVLERAVSEAYHQGTNRDDFIQGTVSAYTWARRGGAFEPSPYIPAALCAVSGDIPEVTQRRRALCRRYFDALEPLEHRGLLKRPLTRPRAEENGHIFYVCLPNRTHRDALRAHLAERGMDARSHYEPLHASEAGRRHGIAPLSLPHTEAMSAGLLRLPLHAALTDAHQNDVIDCVFTWASRL